MNPGHPGAAGLGASGSSTVVCNNPHRGDFGIAQRPTLPRGVPAFPQRQTLNQTFHELLDRTFLMVLTYYLR
jgi:hypothetical protein